MFRFVTLRRKHHSVNMVFICIVAVAVAFISSFSDFSRKKECSIPQKYLIRKGGWCTGNIYVLILFTPYSTLFSKLYGI